MSSIKFIRIDEFQLIQFEQFSFIVLDEFCSV